MDGHLQYEHRKVCRSFTSIVTLQTTWPWWMPPVNKNTPDPTSFMVTNGGVADWPKSNWNTGRTGRKFSGCLALL